MLFSALLVATTGTPLRAEQATTRIKGDVQRSLAGERDLRPIEVRVEGSEVTLAGRVPTLWAKTQAIEKTLDVAGVETVVSELEVPAVENDDELAQEVGRVILGYRYYTMWDHIHGSVTRGVVTLRGSVTPDRDKAADLFERVAKIPGVQDVQTMIEKQSASSRDADLRSVIARRVFRSDYFSKYAELPRPPFHIIVHNRNVRLVGVVRSEVEKRLLERIVRQAFDVVEVVNELQTN